MRFPVSLLLSIAAVVGTATRVESQTPNDYLNFIKAQAAELRRNDKAPESAAEWANRKSVLRKELARAWGDAPDRLGKLETQSFGELKREGYRIEKLAIQTFPGVWMTANAYVPDRAGKLAAILMVHGHWRGAKQDPVVQARCIGAAKKGFFVLVVDAFGAGERGVGRALGEYHGDMTAATLLPSGLTLSGLQVAENIRAVDYLRQRPEVDSARIGITGASGGGNQSMYAAAWDERLRAAAPVCSVGNYQAYLGAACCYCELVPGALRFTEEWGVLAMVAPRALLVINATRDARQFSVDEAKISLGQAGTVFKALGAPAKLRHTIFESGHDYSKPMREAVYGWMTLHLRNEGDASPIAEDEVRTEDPETLRCFPGESRPADWITIPRFAAAEGTRLGAPGKKAVRASDWSKEKERLRSVFVEQLLGGFSSATALSLTLTTNKTENIREFTFSPDPGITLKAKQRFGKDPKRILIVLDLDGATKAATNEIATTGETAGWSVVTIDPRATGELAWPGDKIGRAPDHTTAQWAFWIGRPLLGQWIWDVRRLLDAITEADGAVPNEIAIAGIGPAGILALSAAVIDERITRVITSGTITTFITDAPYEGQRLGIIVPGLLKVLGDVADLAALIAPRPLLISGGVRPNGDAVAPASVRETFEPTAQRYDAFSHHNRLHFAKHTDNTTLARFLSSATQ
jgi:cephalosporin-C deacetylase-like acetyl esterase